MSFPVGASQAPAPSSRGLVSAALATGAAVMAGAVLGRRSLPGIAAGLAAWAGAKWISSSRRPAPLLRPEYGAPEIDLSPEVYSPETKKSADWIDHQSVHFSHDVPDPIHAREMLKDKVLPLLDDNGNAIQDLTEHHIDVAAQPLLSLAPTDESPPDTFVWEPGSGAQSRSEAVCDTVWFGLHEPIVIGGHEPALAVPPLSPIHEVPPQLPHGGMMSGSQVPSDTLIPPPSLLSKRRGAPFAVPVKTATVPLQSVVLPDVPQSVELDLPSPSLPAAGSPFPSAQSHSSPVPFFTSAAVAGASIISPKPNTNSLLPTPRRQGELPKPLAAEVPAPHLSSLSGELPEETRAWLRELPIFPEAAPTAPAMPPRRNLEPLAPMVAFQPAPRRWPLLVLLTLLLGTFLFLAADGWQHGELLRKIKGMSWVQKATVIKEAVSSPSAGAANPTSWTPAPAPLE